MAAVIAIAMDEARGCLLGEVLKVFEKTYAAFFVNMLVYTCLQMSPLEVEFSIRRHPVGYSYVNTVGLQNTLAFSERDC